MLEVAVAGEEMAMVVLREAVVMAVCSLSVRCQFAVVAFVAWHHQGCLTCSRGRERERFCSSVSVATVSLSVQRL